MYVCEVQESTVEPPVGTEDRRTCSSVSIDEKGVNDRTVIVSGVSGATREILLSTSPTLIVIRGPKVWMFIRR